MKAHAVELSCHEFYFANLATLVQVEQFADTVVIRATRNTFSRHRKEYFIRELAAEGFIDDDYRWFSFDEVNPARRLRWLVDFSWLKINPEVTATARRFMWRLFAGSALLWLLLIWALVLRPTG